MNTKEYLKQQGCKNPPIDSGISGGGSEPRRYVSDLMDGYMNLKTKSFSRFDIYTWLESKNYQTDREPTGEYKMYFSIDMPTIIRDFINENICK
jgi:hypothetical protein